MIYPLLILAAVGASILLALLIVAIRTPTENMSFSAREDRHVFPKITATHNAVQVGKKAPVKPANFTVTGRRNS